MNTLVHAQSGDSPLTIRSLYEVAVRQGWNLDAPLAYSDDATMIVRGARPAEGSAYDGMLLYGQLEDEWELAAEGLCPICMKRLDWVTHPNEQLTRRADCSVCLEVPPVESHADHNPVADDTERWVERYDELVTAVYEAARHVLTGWGLAVDTGNDLGVGEMVDEGLGDDLHSWVVSRVRALSDEMREAGIEVPKTPA